jgi:hypothetical protein
VGRRLPAAAVIAAVGVIVMTVSATGATQGTARIAAVTFSGGVSNPTIAVAGANLGQRPRPNPSYRPLGHPPLCPPQPTKPPAAYGFDFGTKLFVEDVGSNRTWSAGRYRPGIGELDCIGLVIVRFSATKVVFHLGAYYREGHFRLAAGDSYRITVNGSTFRGHVRYR